MARYVIQTDDHAGHEIIVGPFDTGTEASRWATEHTPNVFWRLHPYFSPQEFEGTEQMVQCKNCMEVAVNIAPGGYKAQVCRACGSERIN